MPVSADVQERIDRRIPTDEALVSAYVEHGDERAFRELVERHQERVFGFLYGMIHDREVANDLFQETFIRVISALQKERGSYVGQGRFGGWIIRIARNAALDYLRTRKRWQDVSTNRDEDDSSYWDRLPDDSLPMDEALHQADIGDILTHCIERLPSEQKEVLLLRHEAGFTFREIAELTDCSINTALGRMRYALLNMKRMLATTELNDPATVAGTQV